MNGNTVDRFDLNVEPPSSEALTAKLSRLTARRAKLSRRIRAMRALLVVGAVAWIALAIQVLPVDLGRWVIGPLALVIGLLILATRSARAEEANLSVAITHLSPLCPATRPNECIQWGQWTDAYPRARAYASELRALGREPVVGEWNAMRVWVEEEEVRLELEERRHAAALAMVGAGVRGC